MTDYYVMTFHSVSQALAFEKIMLAKGIDVKMIPVPRVISSSCGIAARFFLDGLETVVRHLTESPELADSMYRFTVSDKKTHAERLSGPWDS